MPSPTKTRARKAPAPTTAPPKARATIATPKAPAARATIRVPRGVRDALGDKPGDTIAALLALRDAIGNRAAAADLRANPFLGVRLNATAVYRPFGTSTIAGLRDMLFTEAGLVDEAVRVAPSRSVEQIALAGLLAEAALEVQHDFRRQARAKDDVTPGHGIEGVRDRELTEALARLKATGQAVSPSTLRRQSGGIAAFRACQNFLTRRGAALGLHLLPDGKTYSWTLTEAPIASEPTTPTAPISNATALEQGYTDSEKRRAFMRAINSRNGDSAIDGILAATTGMSREQVIDTLAGAVIGGKVAVFGADSVTDTSPAPGSPGAEKPNNSTVAAARPKRIRKSTPAIAKTDVAAIKTPEA